jgi:DNA-binding MarR family transcriptional regulator
MVPVPTDAAPSNTAATDTALDKAAVAPALLKDSAASAPVPAAVDADTISRVRLAVLRLSRRLRQNAAAGLTPSQLSLLSTLERRGPMTLGDLAAYEGVQPPSVSRMTDTLEKDGLLKRVESPQDRRAVMAQLTAKGRKALDDVRRRRDAWLARRLALISPEDRARLEAALPLLEALAEEHS